MLYKKQQHLTLILPAEHTSRKGKVKRRRLLRWCKRRTGWSVKQNTVVSGSNWSLKPLGQILTPFPQQQNFLPFVPGRASLRIFQLTWEHASCDTSSTSCIDLKGWTLQNLTDSLLYRSNSMYKTEIRGFDSVGAKFTDKWLIEVMITCINII